MSDNALKIGDSVRHKKSKLLRNGVVKEFSQTGKRAYVRWPTTDRYYGFSAYYALGSLVKD